MPKRVDHQERRTLIADALMRVAAGNGLEAVSLRHVATEAGVSTGMVQHYFSTKDEMMVFALSVVRDRNHARVTEAVGRLGDGPHPRALLRAMIAAVLPIDEQSRADGRVALAFLAYTAVRPDAGASLRDDSAALQSFVAGLIGDARAAGDVPAHVDPRQAAAGLLALMEGLGVYLLGGHLTADAALNALDAHLSLVFTHPGQRAAVQPRQDSR